MTPSERIRALRGRLLVATLEVRRAERALLAELATMARDGYSVDVIARDSGLPIATVRAELRRAVRAGMVAWRTRVEARA